MENVKNDEFTRSKIYERLDYIEQPANYRSEVSWIVQNQIAATNGIHYYDRIGKLKRYPVYNLPVPRVSGDKLMLDIGAGWGRWLVAGAHKGYIPIGIDLRLEFCESQQTTLKHFDIKGYSVAADLENIPFQPQVFDLVWSFSVIQHTHIDRLRNCLRRINEILTDNGFAYLEFPNKQGIRNRVANKKYFDVQNDDYNSWDVRYYTIEEYRSLFEEYFKQFRFYNHSFIGIGVLPDDIKYVSPRNKLLCAASLAMSALTRIIPPLKNYSDSIYISAGKKAPGGPNPGVTGWLAHHKTKPFDNLHIVSLMKCPETGVKLTVSPDRKKILAEEAGLYYPVINDIPILIKSEAGRI